ncbi:dual specificity mitogen-activated protein kinase kinase 4 isoform X2 [Hydra vulgaris]|uniref:mitogen-activated protein kinase kinase n=1 Tax=Hydra vulgaris TaxID=6087 RepID=A0ABM4CEJ0_HYDVU
MSSGSVGRLGLSLNDLKIDRSSMCLNFNQKGNVKPSVAVAPPQHQHCSHNVVHLLQSSSGTLTIKDEIYQYTALDLIDLGEIGRGNFGTVNKMRHRESKTEMAVKRIRATIDKDEQRHLLKELDIIMNTTDCIYIVQFYGAIFIEGDCWICMELMTTSVEKTYKAVHKVLMQKVPEEILGKIAYCVIKALDYLKTNLEIIHRDVKPSNILVDKEGQIKLCDFGISGQLVDSIARTRDAGCQPYMAPERIDPSQARSGYDVRSDVWSLGMSLIEIAIGKFPYPKWTTIFDQLSQVIDGDPPKLVNTEHQIFSKNCLDCINSCMAKDFKLRPKYNELLRNPFIISYEKNNNIKEWFNNVLTKVPNLPSLVTDSETHD